MGFSARVVFVFVWVDTYVLSGVREWRGRH